MLLTICSPSTPITSLLEANIVNGETFEEYFRVFHEVRDLMKQKSERTTPGTLGSFARELISSLSPSVDLTPAFLEKKGKDLWELGWKFVQSNKYDDRILYFSRLE